jgi:hypothetical protein
LVVADENTGEVVPGEIASDPKLLSVEIVWVNVKVTVELVVEL